jgi:hypothetical protein
MHRNFKKKKKTHKKINPGNSYFFTYIQRAPHRNTRCSSGSTLPSHRATHSWGSFDQPEKQITKRKLNHNPTNNLQKEK